MGDKMTEEQEAVYDAFWAKYDQAIEQPGWSDRQRLEFQLNELQKLVFTDLPDQVKVQLMKLESLLEHGVALYAKIEVQQKLMPQIMADNSRMRADIARLKREQHEKAREKLLDEAMAAGKIEAKTRPMYSNMFDLDPEGTTQILKTSPPLVGGSNGGLKK